MERKVIITITGPTCSGKSTLGRRLRQLGASELVSFTTRPPRNGEVNGVDYDFLTVDEFADLESRGGIVERTDHGGFSYGLTSGSINRALSKSDVAFAVLDPFGVSQIVSALGSQHAIFSVFIDGSPQTLVARLFDRFRADLGASSMNYAKRLHALLQDCSYWRSMYQWDAIYPFLDDHSGINSTDYVAGQVMARARDRLHTVEGALVD